MTSGAEYIRETDEILNNTYEEPMSLARYVDTVFENPTIASHASKYLLEAIEAAGTRTVIEKGEFKKRYRFFDDPHNEGEHAVLGNTNVLNAFVDDLRSITAERGKAEKIVWFEGPTATGKSELKRCLINGLREYSRTKAGRRYTMEWNIATTSSDPGLTYGTTPNTDEDHWYESPVQSHPLTTFPSAVRDRILKRINEQSDEHLDIQVAGRLDPFCREAYEYLEEFYRREGKDDLFSAITDERHLRVKNFVVDVGRGIGVLHSEDDGTPKERLVGSWMTGMLQELDSRGRKNPQAFSYDGVLSQGNGLLTIVEDATQHADLLQKLLNVPDEGAVKLDKGIGMDIDTQLIIISNPDLEAQLNVHEGRNDSDPLKALKRRLDRHEFKYLINLSLECELIHRELTTENESWSADSYEELDERIRAPLPIRVRDTAESVVIRELAPHAVEAAALYSIITRLDADDLPTGLDLVDKALLFDRGYIRDGDHRLEKDDFEFDPTSRDGDFGIPVTFTRDVIAELLNDERDRQHPELTVENVIMPNDVLDAMVDGLENAPVFSSAERKEFEGRLVMAKNSIYTRQEEDVLSAMMRNNRVDTETVEEYIEHVYAWTTDEPVINDRGERLEPSLIKMKVFETEHLGRFDTEQYDGNEPSPAVRQFRREKIVTSLNRHAWEHRTADFSIEHIDMTQIPVISNVLESHDWSDVNRIFEDFDPAQWDNPPSGTETSALKQETIENMIDMFGYSLASAELTSRKVMSQVSHRWG